VAVRSRKGVIFGSGGFTHNPEFLNQFALGPIYGGCAVITNEGDFINLAQEIGARLSNMNGAWNAEIPLEQALQSPSTPNDIWQPAGDSMILVNKYGIRVTNEKRSYNDRTKVHFYWDPVNQEYPNQILLMVYDQRTRDLYAGSPGGYPIPSQDTSSPDEISAQTFQELGQKVRDRINQISGRVGNWRLADDFESNFISTIDRFNRFADTGKDDDFHRGEFPYDVEWHKNVFSLPAQGTGWPANDKPNITMYPFTTEGPYYCILIAAGTLDTNGGPRTNPLAQVLDTHEKPIPGLYGAGNCIAAPTRYYFGAGGTLGPALTFGYIAGMNATKEPVK
jgi:succinate dehydrogenase/fumarate reductase flavoprotein subunit